MGSARRGTRPARGLGVLIVLVAAVAGTVALSYEQGLDRAVQWVTLFGFPVALVVAYLTWRSLRVDDRSPTDLNHLTAELAEVVRERWQTEERLLRLQDPVPIPVRWARTEEHADHGRNTEKSGSRSSERKAASGTVDRIAAGYRRLPAGRMVVLGEAGAGKSVLCVQLVLGLLNERDDGVPVPVLVRMASWDPARQHPWDYVAEQLVAEFPSLAARTMPNDLARLGGFRGFWARRAHRRAGQVRRETVARALLRTGRLLPVLDGLDEMPADSRGRALRRLNADLNRDEAVVVTSRPEEYEKAVRDGHQLVGATVIRLRPLGSNELAAFLPRTTRAVPESERDKWSTVLQEVRVRPRGVLAQALSTPLMASLARNIYSDTDTDPSELLDFDRFPDRRALAYHLLDEFLPAVYDGPPGLRLDDESHSDDRRGRGRWTSTQARRWLTVLAARTVEEDGDLAWWRLGGAAARALVTVIVLLAFGTTVLLTWWLSFPGTVAVGPIETGLPAWLALALFGAVPWTYLAIMIGKHVPTPRRVRRLLPEVAGSVAWLAVIGLFNVGVLWLGGGALAFFALQCMNKVWELHDSPTRPGTAARIENRVQDPLSVLRDDRTRTLSLVAPSESIALGLCTLVVAPPLVLLVIWNFWAEVSMTALGITVACSVVLLAGLGIVVTAWGRFGVVRIALALTARTPLRLMSFLDDAHRRGVLRYHGSVYRFRHAELFDHLLKDAPVGRTTQRRSRTRSTRSRKSEGFRIVWKVGLTGVTGTLLILGVVGLRGTAQALPPQPGAYRAVAPACQLLFPTRQELKAARQGDQLGPRLRGKVCTWNPPDWSGFVSVRVSGPYSASIPTVNKTEAARSTMNDRRNAAKDPRQLDLGAESFLSRETLGSYVVVVRQGNVVVHLTASSTVRHVDSEQVSDSEKAEVDRAMACYTRWLATKVVMERLDETARRSDIAWPLVDRA